MWICILYNTVLFLFRQSRLIGCKGSLGFHKWQQNEASAKFVELDQSPWLILCGVNGVYGKWFISPGRTPLMWAARHGHLNVASFSGDCECRVESTYRIYQLYTWAHHIIYYIIFPLLNCKYPRLRICELVELVNAQNISPICFCSAGINLVGSQNDIRCCK